MKNILIVLFIIILSIIALGFLRSKENNSRESTMKTLTIGNKTYRVEIADTIEKQTKGLSGRSSLPSDSGMLFVYPQKDIYSFWMKDMQIPLDFIWIDGDKIVDITENVPPPSPQTPDRQLLIYQPKVPVDKVLELNAGEISKLDSSQLKIIL